MPRLTANPNAEASLAFDTVKPGDYAMRVKEISEETSKSGNPMWKITLEYVDPTGCAKLDGSPAKNPGTLIDYCVTTPESQGKLKGFVLACGERWEDLDSENLIGKELTVRVKTEKYEGEDRNKVGRYIFQE